MIAPKNIRFETLIAELKKLRTLKELLSSGDGENMIQLILAASQTADEWVAISKSSANIHALSGIGKICWNGEHRGFDLDEAGGLRFSSWMLKQIAASSKV